MMAYGMFNRVLNLPEVTLNLNGFIPITPLKEYIGDIASIKELDLKKNNKILSILLRFFYRCA